MMIMLISTFIYYWLHRIQHESLFWWRIHATIITLPKWGACGAIDAPARVGYSAVRYSRRPGAFGSERWCYGSGRIVFNMDRHTKSRKLAVKIHAGV